MKNFLFPAVILAIYLPATTLAQSRKDTTLTIRESVVYAAGKPAVPRAGNGSIVVSRAMMGSTPALLGEPDLVKTLQLLPGVKAGTEGFSGLYIRGGGPDENLMMLDGAPLPAQGHMLGLFSVFQEEAVDKVTLHKGAFPTEFGGRASGIIDVRTRDGTAERLRGSIGIGLLSDKFHIEGPVPVKRTSFSVSGRAMHTLLLDGLFKALKVPGNYYFHDFHSKVTHQAGVRDRISLSCFTGKDRLGYEEDDASTTIRWGNSLCSIQWDRQWKEGLASECIAAASDYGLRVRQKASGTQDDFHSGMRDYTMKAVIKMDKLEGNVISFGAETVRHVFSPGIGCSDELSVFGQDRIRIGRFFHIDGGIRMTLSGSRGYHVFSPEPRIGIGMRPSERLEVTAAYSRMTQSVHLLSPSITTLPVDIWVPVTKAVGPVGSGQFSAGIAWDFAPGWSIDLEGYHKTMSNVIEYRDGTMFLDDPSSWESQVAAGIGRSSGMELLVRKSSGRTTGWLGYTLSKSERRFPDGSISGGEWFPCRYDCTHDFTIALNHRLGDAMEVNLSWTYTSSGAMTVPESDGSMPHRGNMRLPPSHRLDIGCQKRRKKGIWRFGLYNAYNRKNPNIVFSLDADGDGPGSLKTVSILPVLPSASYTRVF